MNSNLRATLRFRKNRTAGLALLTAMGLGQSRCGDKGGSNGGVESAGATGLGVSSCAQYGENFERVLRRRWIGGPNSLSVRS